MAYLRNVRIISTENCNMQTLRTVIIDELSRFRFSYGGLGCIPVDLISIMAVLSLLDDIFPFIILRHSSIMMLAFFFCFFFISTRSEQCRSRIILES